jgi:hypothetical protein
MLASCLKSKVCCGKHGKQPAKGKKILQTPWNNIPTGRVRAWEVTIVYCFNGTTLLEVNKSFLLIYYNFFAEFSTFLFSFGSFLSDTGNHRMQDTFMYSLSLLFWLRQSKID